MIKKSINYDSLGNIIVPFYNEKNINYKKIVLCAHYDNILNNPGTIDNACACAILLNLIIDYKEKINAHIDFVFTDLEEKGLIGSSFYCSQNINKIKSAINLDMCGSGKHVLVNISNLNKIKKDNFLYFINSFEKFDVKQIELLPPGDASSFIEKGIETYYIVSSTTKDLQWFNEYAKNKKPTIIPDFVYYMHTSRDTIDQVNMLQVNNIYCFLAQLLEWLLIQSK